MLRVNEANEGFNKMKWSSSPSERKNERILKTKTWKNENNKMKNSGMQSQMIKDKKFEKDEGWMANNELNERANIDTVRW